MRRAAKILLWCAVMLFLAATATCYFGERYALSKIPPEIRAGMEDTDWIGAKWIGLGMILLFGAFVSGMTAFVLVIKHRTRKISDRES